MVGAENKPSVRGSKVAVDRPSFMACLQPAPPPAPEDQGGFTPPTRGPLGRPESLSTPALQTRTQGSETLHGLILYRQYRWNPGLNPRHRHCVPPRHSPAPPKMTPGAPPRALASSRPSSGIPGGWGLKPGREARRGEGGSSLGTSQFRTSWCVYMCVYVCVDVCV